ncbi:helix-turn-helix transcriptional regulator [Microbacterium sp. 3J1]|uniref:helix-turn-helix transcriptional regulator n=1 Tax=Microbacterium sp. 3J1 TaxID=861269 RepID=UPI00159ECF4E|nr:helix-turn-helix transcriptional regulator [Microbacterium sp. 3J1]
MSAHRATEVAAATMEDVLDALLENDLACAPHVVARIVAEVTADPQAVRAVAGLLDASQRHGLKPLPSPLPLIESVRVLFADLTLDQRDRELLVAASLRLDDRLDPLLDFDGRTADALAQCAVAEFLLIHAGRVRIADPRLSIWLRATTTASTVAAVHSRLHAIFLARGEKVDADWHRARASLYGVPETAEELIRIAYEHSAAGLSERALDLAREAAAHATGGRRDEALVVAGVAAMSAGYPVEAVDQLSGLFPDAEEGWRLRSLSSLFIAQAHLQGAVPDVPLEMLAPRDDVKEHWYRWARASAFAAVLSAERGERQSMRVWLDEMREACSRGGVERGLRDPVVALAWLIVGERDVDDAEGTGPLTGGVLRAIRAARNGDIDRGLRVLAAGDSGIGMADDPFVAGLERSPLVAAYRAVTESLLLMWRGDIAVARTRLLRASLELPVALPFGGLAVVMARRLDLAVLGHLGPFSRALTAVLPPALRIDQLVDRGIQAYLSGAFDEAASFMRLWRDRGARQPALSVPGLEEVADAAGLAPPTGRRIEPPEISLAQELRSRISTCTDRDWLSEYPRIKAATRSIGSPFTRGRVEAMLGARSLIRGDAAAGAGHLEAAQNLFELCGADAWSRAVSERRRRADAGERRVSAPGQDPLAASRRIWEPILTTRELEVAMLAVEGAANRQISSTLHLSVRTVEVHLGRVFAKLEVKTRVELTVLAHRIGRYA